MGRKSIKKSNYRRNLTKKVKQKGGVPSRQEMLERELEFFIDEFGPVDFDSLEEAILHNNLEKCVEILEIMGAHHSH